MKQKKIVYIIQDHDFQEHLEIVNVSDEELEKLLEIKHKRKIVVGDRKLQLCNKIEFEDHDRYYLVEYDMNKTDVTGLLNLAALSEDVKNHRKTLTSNELIEFHDTMFMDAVGTIGVEWTEQMWNQMLKDEI